MSMPATPPSPLATATEPRRVLIVLPAAGVQHTGNQRTTVRYEAMLAALGHRVQSCAGLPSEAQLDWAEVGLVLHACKSLPALQALHARGRPVALVVTGTDLYQDYAPEHLGSPCYGAVETALGLAKRVVCLQRRAAEELSERLPSLKGRLRVIPQTVAARTNQAGQDLHVQPWQPGEGLRLLVVGHIRPVKDPLTALLAFEQLLADPGLPPDQLPGIDLVHVGGSLDAELTHDLQQRAERLRAQGARIALLGEQSPERVGELIQAAHLLIQPSRMEGGALVISEACAAGLPVLASDMPGHRGILGEDYPGFYPVGDAAALAARIRLWLRQPQDRETIQSAMQALAPALTRPATETTQLKALIQGLCA